MWKRYVVVEFFFFLILVSLRPPVLISLLGTGTRPHPAGGATLPPVRDVTSDTALGSVTGCVRP